MTAQADVNLDTMRGVYSFTQTMHASCEEGSKARLLPPALRLMLAGLMSSVIAVMSWHASNQRGFNPEDAQVIGGAYAIAIWLCFLKVMENQILLRLLALVIVSSLAYYAAYSLCVELIIQVFSFPLAGTIGASITVFGLVHILSVPDRLRVAAIFIAAGTVGAASAYPISLIPGINSRLPWWLGDFFLFAPWQVLTLAALAPTLARMEREAALRRIEPHCKKCDYNLTGNVSGICPECGTPVMRQ